jgi:hypothetical protein
MLLGHVKQARRSDGIFHEFSNGDQLLFEMSKQKVGIGACMEYADGTKQYYEGLRGLERVVRIEYPDGVTCFYEGPKGCEREVRIVQTPVPSDSPDRPDAGKQKLPRVPSHGVILLGRAKNLVNPLMKADPSALLTSTLPKLVANPWSSNGASAGRLANSRSKASG